MKNKRKRTKITKELIMKMSESIGYQFVEGDCNCANDKFILNCHKHGNFKSNYRTLYKGCGCPKCGVEKSKNAKIKTIDVVRQELLENNMILLSKEYKSCEEDLYVMCKICGHKFYKNLDQIKHQKIKCPNCLKKRENPTKLKQDDVEIRLNSFGFALVGEYIDYKTSVEVKCNIHNTIFKASLASIERGRKCPTCIKENYIKSNKYTNEQINKCLEENGFEWIYGEYKDVDSKLKLKCLKHNVIWETTFRIIKNSYQCPECVKINMRNKFKKSMKEVIKIIEDEGYEYVYGQYNNLNSKIGIKCKYCGETWDISLGNFINGRRCPICRISKGERKVYEYLKSINVNFEREYIFNDLISKNACNLRYDFVIFDNENIKLLIEYDGIFHYKAIMGEDHLKEQKERDELKNKYCKIHNIKLVRIPYWEFDNVEIILDDILTKNNMNNNFIFIK